MLKVLKNKEKLSLVYKEKLLKTFTPTPGGVYSFKLGKEECNVMYIEQTVKGVVKKRLCLYPINVFNPNIIEL